MSEGRLDRLLAPLQGVLQATSRLRGEAFLRGLVRLLSGALQVRYVLVARVTDSEPRCAKVVAAWAGDTWSERFEYALAGTPCENVLAQDTCWYPDGVQLLFPDDSLLVDMGVRGYLGTPLRGRDGRPVGVFAVLHSEPLEDERPIRWALDLFAGRVAAELELLATAAPGPSPPSEDRQRLKAFVDESVAGAYCYEMDPPMPVDLPLQQQVDWILHRSRLVEANDAYARLVEGSSAAEVLGASLAQLLGPDKESARRPLASLIRGNYHWDQVETRFQMRSGEYRWSLERTQARIQHGLVSRFWGTAFDITASKRAVEELRRSEAMFRGLADSIDDVFFALDPEFRYVYWNDACDRLFGVPAERMIGTSYFDFKPNQGYEWIADRYREVMGTGASQVFEVTFDGASGTAHYEVKAYPTPSGCAVILNDVTERKRAHLELREAAGQITALKERLTAENVVLRAEVDRIAEPGTIVGQSEVLQTVLAQARQVAEVESTVLLLGETGTGKEILARAIHDWSERRHQRMVCVNCASIPAPLMESELFGREKGAYTGAHSRRIGRFEAARGGTLFLDEVGELPLQVQGKLLRVLEEGRFERLGSTTTLEADVRIIAATNRDLAAEVAAGRFRQDLLFRLDVFPITLPPLRDRREDIRPLVWHFVREIGARMGKAFEELHGPSLHALERYPWPGNVRELRNAVERAMILAEGPVLRIPTPTVRSPVDAGPISLEQCQRRHILKVLELTGWRVRGEGGAGAILGLKPTTLESRMKKLNIRRPPGMP